MTLLATANIALPERRRKSELFRRLLHAAPQDAADTARDFCIELIGATIYSPEHVQRLAGTVFLVFLDALNDRRAPRSRESRWRRFALLLSALSREIDSPAFTTFLGENSDLL